ncbi:TetR/AcrR family transcriptional regulator [Alcanivorax marinus]|uniref:TetR/AcrR family transcriptional regulator n=1 Tax=Alloalcanivorax marinus TaxID=1177169 RepID=A0A9Q3YML3_9GAMM|nr:TetR/AcrR family transcriptional regulator [Alloalcanivorax marinus]MCC4306960.1 TetR/AcrR family transcriptional regulator [Alloalcanivorax marinus]
MDHRSKLLKAAEQLFDRHGFTATGMDRLTRDAGMSSRTLYKLAGSKAALIASVLTERDRRFLQRMDVDSLEGLFDALADWIRAEGARGCLFLRAQGETGGNQAAITAALWAHKQALFERIQAILAAETGGREDPVLAEQVMILHEGATAAAVYRGVDAVAAARAAAIALVRAGPS